MSDVYRKVMCSLCDSVIHAADGHVLTMLKIVGQEDVDEVSSDVRVCACQHR